MNQTLVLADGRRIEVAGPVELGREPSVDVVLDDDQVSRRHAVVRPGAGGLEVEDLGSSNGTFVDGRRTEGAVALPPGSSLRVGNTTLTVEGVRVAATMVAPAAEPPPLPPFTPPATRPRGRVASRQLGPAVASVATIVATAAALIVYFAIR